MGFSLIDWSRVGVRAQPNSEQHESDRLRDAQYETVASQPLLTTAITQQGTAEEEELKWLLVRTLGSGVDKKSR